MAKNSMEYSDIFCQAVQNIVNGSVSNLNFDMSKECTITEIINKSYGRYEVYDGSISFEAVATEGSTYQVGDSVMVTIPQGDSNKQIVILNKIIDEWTGPAGFVRPLDTLVSCTGNIAFNNHKQRSLIANGSRSSINVLTLKRQKFFGFQKIGVSAKFRSLLNNLGVSKGDYGLMFTFIQKSNNQDIADYIKQYKFSCSDMLGNPYAFNTYFKQEYAFDIDSTITQINELYVDFYQDAQFKDGNDNLIKATEYANLFVKDLEIYFGYPQDKEISEVVEIYSDNFEYSGNGPGIKQVYLQWIHKTDDYHLEHVTKEEYSKENSPYEVRWYQYTSGCDDSKTDEYGGKHWELLNKVRPSSSSVNYPFEFVINVRPTYIEEKVKVVCLVRTHPLTNDPTYEQITRFDSNILIFQNLQEEAGEDAPPQEILQKNLSLHFHDNSYGNYFLYDQNGRLIDGTNQGETYKRRIEIFYDGSPIVENADWYNSIQAVSWEAPATNQQTSSMICYDKYYDEGSFIEPNKNLLYDAEKEAYALTENDLKKQGYKGTLEEMRKQFILDNENKAVNIENWEIVTISSDGEQQTSGSIASNSTSSNDNLYSLTINKSLDETKYLATQLEHNTNGKFNLSLEKIKILISGASDIPSNLIATLKVSIWTTNNEQWSDSNGESGTKWTLINNQYQNFYLKNGEISIDNISKLCPITREHKKVMIGFNFMFDKTNEDFNQFIENENNQDIEFKLYLDRESTKMSFVIQSEFYTNTTYPTIKDDGTRNLNTYFDYSIYGVWYKDRSNNSIRCRVTIDDKDYLLQEELRFGTKGSNGTNNTLILEMTDGKNALTVGGGETLTIDAMLIKGDGKRVTLDSTQIDWTLINNTLIDDQNYITDGSKITLKMKEGIVNEDLKSNYTILKASVKYNTGEEINPVLEAYLPIPIKHNNCIGMSGTKEVIYNNQGVPPFENGIYIAYMLDGKQYTDGWNITQPTEKPLNPNPVSLKNGVSGVGKSLSTAPLYSKGIGNGPIYDKICVYYENNGTVMWSQPILIMQSAYDFAMLNSWDGEFKIDEDEGYILASMLGAGKKDKDNKFSGVLLGDVAAKTGNTTISQTGVYGFQSGIMTYALKEDGTGFFGGSGNGRIEFDGTNGTISSNGWKKDTKGTWTLNGKTTGTLLDLSNGKLIMQGGNDSYFKFNDKGQGALEMALSGLNIKLTDKTNDPSLSGYIDVTAQKLVSEFRRTATYAVTCSTGDSLTSDGLINNNNIIKALKLSDFTKNDFFKSDSLQETDKGYVGALTLEDIEKDGVTIAVTFTYPETVKKTNIQIQQKIDDDTKATTIGYRELNIGRSLSLQIESNKKVPIYINGKATNNTPSLVVESGYANAANLNEKLQEEKPTITEEENKNLINNSNGNPYGWSAGSTIYFTYKNKHWEVSDGGSYSRITQTSDLIKSEVSNISGILGSSITQTAGSIRMEVAKKATYKCACATNDGAKVKVIDTVLTDSKGNKVKALSSGCIINVTFSKAETTGEGLSFKFKNNTNSEGKNLEYSINGTVIWKAGETLPFIFDGSTWTVTSISNASIDIRDNRITSEVRRTAGYACTYPDEAPTNDVYAVTLLNPSDGLTVNDILQNGVTLAVTFNRARTSASTSGLKLKVKFADKTTAQKSIYFKGKAANEENYPDGTHFTWAKGDTIYFAYSSGRWNIVDSGAYSKITQTADSLVAKVGGNTESFSWILEKDHFSLYSGKQSVENRVFYCDSEGIEVNGKITATSGKIGDFFISGNVLMTENYIQVKDGKVVKDSKTNNPVYVTKENGYKDGVYIGPDCIKLGKYFQVNKNGSLYAKKGQIGGIEIYNNHLGTEGASINSAEGSGHFYIGPDGININGKIKITKDGSAVFKGNISANQINSGTLGDTYLSTTIVNGAADGTSALSLYNTLVNGGPNLPTLHAGAIFCRYGGSGYTFVPRRITINGVGHTVLAT